MNAGAVTAPSNFGAVLRAAIAAVGVAYFYTGIDDYAWRFMGAPSPQILLALFLGAMVVLTAIEPRAPLPVLRSPFMMWLVAYFAITLAWGVWMRHSVIADEALRGRFRSVALLATFTLVFSAPKARRVGILAVAVAVVFASLLNVAEFMQIIQFAVQEADPRRVTGRSAGLHVNPNASGMAIVLGLAITLKELPRMMRYPLLAIATIGVVTTFSRGAQVCLAVLLAFQFWRRTLRLSAPALVAILLGAMLAATMQAPQVVRYLESRELINDRTLARLQFEADDSGRTSLAMKALDMFLEAPVLGKGLAASLDWDDPTNSSHNQFLNLAADHGILGLLLFPALALALVHRNRGAIPFAAVLMLAGFVSHNLLNERAFLVLICLVAGEYGAVAGYDEREESPAAEPGVT